MYHILKQVSVSSRKREAVGFIFTFMLIEWLSCEQMQRDGVPRKLSQCRAELQRAGFYLDHQTGSHEIWKHQLISGISVNLVGKDSADAKPYQEREIQAATQKLKDIQQ